MNDRHIEYLSDIGVTEVFGDRIEQILRVYSSLLPEKYSSVDWDIFVSEYREDDGTRQYQSLWIFADDLIMEAKNFIKDDDFDFAPVRHRIRHGQLVPENFDFQLSTEASRLYVTAVLLGDLFCVFRATGKNCEYLANLCRTHLVGNIVTHAARE